MRKVYGLIRTLGATSKYKGYYFVAEAVKLSMGFAEKPGLITKDVYPCLARKFKSTPVNVELDIRTVINNPAFGDCFFDICNIAYAMSFCNHFIRIV